MKTRQAKALQSNRIQRLAKAGVRAPSRGGARSPKMREGAQWLIDEALASDLLKGEKSAHVTARTTPAVIAEARRRTGIVSTSKLIETALALLAIFATPDPAAEYMKKHYGALGPDHTLDY